MQVSTNVLDVLPDGTVIKLILETEEMSLTIGREDPDEQFIIEKVDERDEKRMEEIFVSLDGSR